MIDIMIEISAYIFVAILLGYFFGWLITKLFLTERYQRHLDDIMLNTNSEVTETHKIKDELYQYKEDNKRLRTQNQDLNFGYDGQKYVLAEHNATLDDFQKRLLSKDEVISTLTRKLSLLEETQLQIEKEHEEEIDAFMFERIDITEKYKDILAKTNLLKQHKSISSTKESWFSSFFSSPTPTRIA